jgi:5,10-methylenetetrahydromethanopterin reductase
MWTWEARADRVSIDRETLEWRAMEAKFGILEIPRGVESAVGYARLAEDVGFDLVGVADSQSLFREPFVTLGQIGQATERVMIGTAVTNPVTRHPAVMASAIATVQEVSGGRAMLGIGTGDSAIYNINERPRGLAGLRDYVLALRKLLAGERAEFGGREIHTRWTGGLDQPPVPIYISAEGPKTLELAGEIADGVFCGMGLSPEVVALSLEHLRIGAERAGRSPEDLDVWTLARVNVGGDLAALTGEVRMELASTAHHAFRFTLDGKLVPPEFADAIRAVQSGYQPAHHEDLGESPNARLMADPALLSYMASRFAVLGTPEQCAEQIMRIRAAGFHRILFTGFVDERAALIEALGRDVFPRCRN